MATNFDINAYLNHIAQELIRNYAFASDATTPSLIGGAREAEVRKKLSTLLPRTVSVGTGCIIDSYGNTSKQIDIIIYEKEHCPVFSINDHPESTYFPCEGVIAVGEVKSSLDGKELDDIFSKINSVKSLQRYPYPSVSEFTGKTIISYRHYGSTLSWDCAEEEQFDQKSKKTDQIFGFAFCGNLNLEPETLAEKYTNLLKKYEKCNVPNLISILNYGLVIYMNKAKKSIRYWPGDDADTVYVTSKRDNNFQYLLARLNEVIQKGRTVEVSAFNRYITPSAGNVLLDGIYKNIE
ncbi:hypothetical protein QNI16_26340 [Cytophagaceae bacterium YF14B1]|uniref:DUF6602 domain-containing protein n=1 Tax=Xanthocytophaga flava TaxID=3048013 RepID=A0AAE3QWE7_9BACT|nr:DUF6602 domain-containing protein [Xanthocytophaga flavus]MDJ1484044.1 hypothetical protein [Xanthocytophaga flavus]